MSNERSPREVCSITIGINGLMLAPCCRGSTVSSLAGRIPCRVSRCSHGRARARLGQRSSCLNTRLLDEQVRSRGAEVGLGLLLEDVPDALLDVGSQLLQGVELARGARHLVVERRQLLLLDLLERQGRL